MPSFRMHILYWSSSSDFEMLLYQEMCTVSGQKSHKCEYCNYVAATSSNLKRHQNIHLDVREHQCLQCGQTFRQKIHLERHIKYKHEVKLTAHTADNIFLFFQILKQ